MAIFPGRRSSFAFVDVKNSGSVPRQSFRILLCIVLSLISVAILYVAARLILHHLRRRRRSAGAAAALPTSASPGSVTAAGLGSATIAAVPTFFYNGGAGEGGGECSVCLSAAEEGEAMKMLPNCKHFFHAECIDRWLRSRPTCPVCREDLRPWRAAEGCQLLVAPPMPERVGGGGFLRPVRVETSFSCE